MIAADGDDRPKKTPWIPGHFLCERRGPESNRRIGVLQTPALPLGYRARGHASYSGSGTISSEMTTEATPQSGNTVDPTAGDERRGGPETRGRTHLFWDAIFTAVRGIGGVAKNFYATFGIFLLAGGLVAVLGTYAFAKFAGHVRSGSTQAFDNAVLQWFAQYRTPTRDAIMIEITFLGTGTVVLMIVAISGMFLWLTKHK